MHTGFWWESQKKTRLLRRPKRRWDDNIKMDLREIGWSDMAWIRVVQDRDKCWALVNTVMNLRVLYNLMKSLSSWTTARFSRIQFHGVS
jgi:hypothetical protein